MPQEAPVEKRTQTPPESEGGIAIYDPRLSTALAPAREWGPVDDVVMGGVSRSGFSTVSGAGEDGAPGGVFSGDVTTANNGGFASVRTRNIDPPLDLSSCDGLEIRLFGTLMSSLIHQGHILLGQSLLLT